MHTKVIPRRPIAQTHAEKLPRPPKVSRRNVAIRADDWNEDGFDEREPSGAGAEQPRRRAAAEMEIVAEAGSIERRLRGRRRRRVVDWPDGIVDVR